MHPNFLVIDKSLKFRVKFESKIKFRNFNNTLGGDGEVAAVRRAGDAAARGPGSGRHSAQRHEPRASAAGADAGARRVRDVAAERRPCAGVLGGARVAWVRGPQPEVCMRGWQCAFGPAGVRRRPGLAYGEALCSERTPMNATAPLEPLEVMITKYACEQVV